MEVKKASWVKIGMFCGSFCALAGFLYGMFPARNVSITLITLSIMLFVTIICFGYLICAVAQKRSVETDFIVFVLLLMVGTATYWFMAGCGYYIEFDRPVLHLKFPR